MTSSAPQVTPSGWTIVGQVERQQLSAGNQFVKGMDITFVTGHGVTGSVFIPYAQLTPAYISEQITARAAQLDIVSNLSAPDQR